jgi:hypothetical protein
MTSQSGCPSVLVHYLSSTYPYPLTPRSCEGASLKPFSPSCGASYLAVFALEIFDLAFHLRHLILQISHVLVDLLHLELQITRPILDLIAIRLLLQGLLNLWYLLEGLLDLPQRLFRRMGFLGGHIYLAFLRPNWE